MKPGGKEEFLSDLFSIQGHATLPGLSHVVNSLPHVLSNHMLDPLPTSLASLVAFNLQGHLADKEEGSAWKESPPLSPVS